MAGPAIRFDQVGLTLGGSPILREVSFDIAAGALHCIVGPNGGGKSSLVRTLLGEMPHTGRVALDGPQGPIGYVPQAMDFDRNLPMTVLDVMALMRQRRPAFLGATAVLRREAEELLARVGASSTLRTPFGALSGGERQRVLLAQALAPPPGLLILDEPTAGLDEEGARRIEGLVLDLHRRGVTVIWINHDLDQVRRIATGVTVISRTVAYHGAPGGLPDRALSQAPQEA